MKTKVTLLIALFATTFSAHASIAASGKVIAATTFSTSNAFHFFNNSTENETITQLIWDLSPINGFFDTTSSAPGTLYSGLQISNSSDTVGQQFPTNTSVNGSSILSINFNEFDAGESFIFGVDTDFFSDIDATGINGEGFIGALVTAIFSDGGSLQGTYQSTSLSGFGSEVFINQPVSEVPIPASYLLFGSAMFGFMSLTRRSNDNTPY